MSSINSSKPEDRDQKDGTPNSVSMASISQKSKLKYSDNANDDEKILIEKTNLKNDESFANFEEDIKQTKKSKSSKSAIQLLVDQSNNKNPEQDQIHYEDNEEIEAAQKKLQKKAKKFNQQKEEKEQKQLISQKEDEILNMQKQAAIDVIRDAAQYNKNYEMVRDDTYNEKLLEKISNVEEKIDQLDLIFSQLLSRGRFIGREQEILPWISSVLQLIVQLFHKVNLEAFRIGVLNRQLVLPETQTMNLETTYEWINVCKVQYDITAKIFKLILAFMRTYINNSFNVVMYVNMNRIVKSEYDIILIHKEMRTIMRKANFFRVQNIIFTKYFAHKWAHSTREQMNAMNANKNAGGVSGLSNDEKANK